MNKHSLLQDDQKEALKLIKKFIQSNNKDIFILEGSLNSGKSFREVGKITGISANTIKTMIEKPELYE